MNCIEFGCDNKAPQGFALCDECADRVYTSLGKSIRKVLQGNQNDEMKDAKGVTHGVREQNQDRA